MAGSVANCTISWFITMGVHMIISTGNYSAAIQQAAQKVVKIAPRPTLSLPSHKLCTLVS